MFDQNLLLVVYHLTRLACLVLAVKRGAGRRARVSLTGRPVGHLFQTILGAGGERRRGAARGQ